MAGDDLDEARERARDAVREFARYPSSGNASRAREAVAKLQRLARRAAAQRVEYERGNLAERIRQMTRR